MRLYIIAVIIILLASAQSYALQTGSVEKDSARLSVDWHFIEYGADANSYSLVAEAGLSDRFGLGLERTRISDGDGSITMGSLFGKRELYESPKNAGDAVSAYGGLRFLDGESTLVGDMQTGGIVLGLVGQKALSDKITLYGRAGVSFFNDTLAETEIAAGWNAYRNLELTAGYRTYFINGDSLGGFTIGVAAGF